MLCFADGRLLCEDSKDYFMHIIAFQCNVGCPLEREREGYQHSIVFHVVVHVKERVAVLMVFWDCF